MAQCIKILATKLKSLKPSWWEEPIALHKLWFPSEALYLSQAYKMLKLWWLTGLHSVRSVWGCSLCHHAHRGQHAGASSLPLLCVFQIQTQGIRLGSKHLYVLSYLAADPMQCSWWLTMAGWRQIGSPQDHKRQAGQWCGRQEAYTSDPVTCLPKTCAF